MNTILFRILNVLLILSFTCFSASAKDEPAATSVIKVGAILGLSGPSALAGDYARMGLELALEEANQTSSRQFKLIVEDSATTAKGSVSAFRKLTAADGVKVVVGDVWDLTTNPLIPLSERAKTVIISPKVVYQALQGQSDYFFTMGPNLDLADGALTQFFKLQPNKKRVGVFCVESPWGHAWLSVWKKATEASGARFDKVLCNPVEWDHDYRTDAAQMIQASPDLMILSFHVDRILRRLTELKYKVPTLTSYDILLPLKDGTLSKELAEGLYYVDWAAGREFEEKFKNRYGKEALLETQNAYEAGRSIVKAFEIDPEGQNLQSALRQVHYEGVAGKIDFSSGPAANHSEAALYVIRNGKPEMVQ